MPRRRDTTPHRPPATLRLRSSREAQGGATSFTPPDCDQFPWAVSHALLIGMEDKNETLASVCETMEITLAQGLSALATTGKRISELVSAYPAPVPPLAKN